MRTIFVKIGNSIEIICLFVLCYKMMNYNFFNILEKKGE